MPARVLVIGIDSGDPGLLKMWSEAGDLPNLKSFAARAVGARTKNPEGLETGSVWPCFHTGLNPGHQPQFDGLRHFATDRYEFAHYGSDAAAPPFWRELSRAGKRAFVFDSPYCHLDPAINGIHIVDYGTHVSARGTGRLELTTQPPSVRGEILKIAGPDPLGGIPCDDNLCETIDEYRRFRDAHLERIRRKAKITTHYLAGQDWDYFEVVFCDLHCMGHHLWHINDAKHPRYDAAFASALGEPLRDGYRAFDAALGEILAVAGPETMVVLFASHGMGPQHTGTGLLDRILARLEAGPPIQERGLSLKGRVRRVWRALPADLRDKLKPVTRKFTGALQHPTFLPNRSSRKLFEVHASNVVGGVRVNLIGREANGLVSSDELEPLLDQVAAALLEIVNVETGERLVREVLKPSTLYPGEHLDALPDLLVVWNRNDPIRTVASPKLGTLHQEYLDARTGDHTVEGMVWAAGPGIAPGELNAPVQPVDFPPTFREVLGLPARMDDGRAIVAMTRKPSEAPAQPRSAFKA